MTGHQQVDPDRAGVTLIELLTALAIGTLALSALLLAHHALTNNARQNLDRIEHHELAQRTIALLREDLQQVFHPPGATNCFIELAQDETRLIRLTFCRQTPQPGGGLPAPAPAERVTYWVDAGGQPPLLMRTVQPMAGPAAGVATTNRPDRAWPYFHLHLHDGTAWQTNWSDAIEATPRAARIVLLDPERNFAPVHETMWVIPAGLSVTSTILRAAAGAP